MKRCFPIGGEQPRPLCGFQIYRSVSGVPRSGGNARHVQIGYTQPIRLGRCFPAVRIFTFQGLEVGRTGRLKRADAAVIDAALAWPHVRPNHFAI